MGIWASLLKGGAGSGSLVGRLNRDHQFFLAWHEQPPIAQFAAPNERILKMCAGHCSQAAEGEAANRRWPHRTTRHPVHLGGYGGYAGLAHKLIYLYRHTRHTRQIV